MPPEPAAPADLLSRNPATMTDDELMAGIQMMSEGLDAAARKAEMNTNTETTGAAMPDKTAEMAAADEAALAETEAPIAEAEEEAAEAAGAVDEGEAAEVEAALAEGGEEMATPELRDLAKMVLTKELPEVVDHLVDQLVKVAGVAETLKVFEGLKMVGKNEVGPRFEKAYNDRTRGGSAFGDGMKFLMAQEGSAPPPEGAAV